MIITSTYRDSKKDQFLLEVISEDENNYYVRLLPEYQDHFQEHNTITPLRKCLVHKGGIYEVVKETMNVQLSLFD